MHRFVPRLAAAIALAALGWPLATAAQVQRTFVASSGVDADPCTFAQPCRSFAAAIAQTVDGGEIIVLDSAGYGAVTIAQSASIIAASGVYAGITVFSGNGVTVAGVGTRARVSGITINGQGRDIGIYFQQGARLSVDHCVISALGGTTLLTLHASVATANSGSGALASGAGATVSVTGSARVRNTGFGLEQTTAAALRSLVNNTVEDNVAGATAGTITNSSVI